MFPSGSGKLSGSPALHPPASATVQRVPSRHQAFTLIELMVVIGIIAVLLVAVVPAVNSLSKSGGRKAAVGNLLGALEQARMAAVRDGKATYIVFPDQLPVSADPALAQRYQYRSFAIFEEDAANPGQPKQLTGWKFLPTGVSLRAASLDALGNSISFPFTPLNSQAEFRFVKFNANGEVDGSSTPAVASGPITIGVFEGTVSGGVDAATSTDKNLTETITIARLTGRASQTH